MVDEINIEVDFFDNNFLDPGYSAAVIVNADRNKNLKIFVSFSYIQPRPTKCCMLDSIRVPL